MLRLAASQLSWEERSLGASLDLHVDTANRYLRNLIMDFYLAGALALCLSISCRSDTAGSPAPGATTALHALEPAASIEVPVASSTEVPAASSTVVAPDAATSDVPAPVMADAIPLEEFLERLDACDVESCRRQLLVARVEGRQLPPKPAWGDFASRLASCKTSECVIELFPVDQRPPIDFGGCKPLDQHISSERFSEDLGLVCRVRVARAKATRRKQFPCKNLGGVNPDFTVNEQRLRMQVLNDLVRQKHLDALGFPSKRSVSANNFTIHASYVVDYPVSDRAGTAQGYARVYFCMSGEPERYHPYFFALVQRGERRADEPDQIPPDVPVLTEYIETPPAKRHVVYQLGEWDSKDAVAYELSDLDGNGIQDLIVIDQHREAETTSYMLRACLFEPKVADCRKLQTTVRFAIDPASLTKLRWSTPLLSVEKGVVTVSLKDTPELQARARFRVRKRQLQPID